MLFLMEDIKLLVAENLAFYIRIYLYKKVVTFFFV